MREYYADQIGGRIGLGEARSTPRIPRATMANDLYFNVYLTAYILTIKHIRNIKQTKI